MPVTRELIEEIREDIRRNPGLAAEMYRRNFEEISRMKESDYVKERMDDEYESKQDKDSHVKKLKHDYREFMKDARDTYTAFLKEYAEYNASNLNGDIDIHFDEYEEGEDKPPKHKFDQETIDDLKGIILSDKNQVKDTLKNARKVVNQDLDSFAREIAKLQGLKYAKGSRKNIKDMIKLDYKERKDKARQFIKLYNTAVKELAKEKKEEKKLLSKMGPKKPSRSQACRAKGKEYITYKGKKRCVSPGYRSRAACRKKKRQGYKYSKKTKRCVLSARKRASICRSRGKVYNPLSNKCEPRQTKAGAVTSTKWSKSEWEKYCADQGMHASLRKSGHGCTKTSKKSRSIKSRREDCKAKGKTFAQNREGKWRCR